MLAPARSILALRVQDQASKPLTDPRDLCPVAPHQFSQERRAVRDALARLPPGLAEPPVDGPDEGVLAAQDAARREDGGAVMPHAVANLLDFPRPDESHLSPGGCPSSSPPPFCLRR